MKKCVCLVLVAVFCLLAGCRASDPENLFGTTVGTDTATEATVQTSGWETGDTAYSYGNMQKNLPSGSYMRYGNDVVFDVLIDHEFRLLSYDMESGEVGYFSKDATRAGSLTIYSNLEAYDGKLYALNRGHEIVEVMVGALKPLNCRPLNRSSVDSFWHSNGNLYVTTNDASLLVFENGSEKPRTLLDEYKGYWNVVLGRYLYGREGYDIIRVDLEAEKPQKEVLIENATGMVDGHHIYYTNMETDILYRCDLDGSNQMLLSEKPILFASMNFDEEYVYFRLYTDSRIDGNADCYDIYRFPKEDPSQIEKIVTLPVPVYQVFTVPGYDKFFVETLGDTYDEFGNRLRGPIYVVGCDGSNPKALELPDY